MNIYIHGDHFGAINAPVFYGHVLFEIVFHWNKLEEVHCCFIVFLH